MPIVPIEQVSQHGLIVDTPPYALPQNAWSGGLNIRFEDNGVKKAEGYREIFDGCPFPPKYIHPYLDIEGQYYWLAYGDEAIAVYNGSGWTDVTRQTALTLNGNVTAGDNTITVDVTPALTSLDATGHLTIGTDWTGDVNVNQYEEVEYTARDTVSGVITLLAPLQYDHPDNARVVLSKDTRNTTQAYTGNGVEYKWTHTDHNGLIVATNGIDPPQMWPLTNGVPDITVPFRPLNNFPTYENDRCEVIRSYKTFLVGLNWNRSDKMPRLVKWSTESSYYSEPSTWDETDATLDAGEYELVDTFSEIIDGRPLGDAFMIYKEQAIYAMNYVGTPYIFSFKLMSPSVGALSKNSVVEFEGGHFFMGNSDFYVNNGQSITHILNKRMQKAVYNNITGDAYQKCYAVADHARNEIWACYPSGASDYVDRALVWNWKDNTCALRTLPDSAHISYGIAEIEEGRYWDASTQEWDFGEGVWGERNYESVKKNIVISDEVNSNLYRDNFGNLEDTTPMYSFVERTGYDLGDGRSVKWVSAVYPQMTVSGDNSVKVYVGRQMAPEDPVTWEGPTLFNPKTQSKVSCRISGKYFGIKIESESDLDWKLHGVHFFVEPRGLRGIRDYG